MCDRDRREGEFFTGLIFGALIGAGLYYFLTATEEGKRIKKRLEEKGEKAFDQLSDLIEEIEERGEEFRKKAQEIQLQLEEKTQGFSKGTVKEVQERLTQIDRLRERGRRAAQKFFTRNGKSLL